LRLVTSSSRSESTACGERMMIMPAPFGIVDCRFQISY
jgi:hypothetical protein